MMVWEGHWEQDKDKDGERLVKKEENREKGDGNIKEMKR